MMYTRNDEEFGLVTRKASEEANQHRAITHLHDIEPNRLAKEGKPSDPY